MTTLSDKIIEIPDEEGIWNGDMAYKEEDVKQFIKDLKNRCNSVLTSKIEVTPELKSYREAIRHFKRLIDELAGLELTT